MNLYALHEHSYLQGEKYRIIRVLGQGGFGITYLAEQSMLKIRVAIKEFFINDLCARDDSSTVFTVTQSDMVERYRQKFIKEAQMIARLKHPGIVNVSDIFEENGTVYYVMDYIEGESLAEKVKRNGPLSEQTALRYIFKVAEALDFLHNSHVNHLDIKPANIMVRKVDDEPIIIDFGVSKQYDEQKDQTTTTPPGVSTGYSPLEQYIPGGVSTFSPQADIYSLGATLYKLLTGTTPPNASEILSKGLPLMPTSVSPSIRKAIEKAMQPKLSDRPKNISEFIGMMESHQLDELKKLGVKYEKSKKTIGVDKKKGKTEGTTIVIGLKRESIYDNPIIDNLVANMVFVEGGTFTMGATSEQETDMWNDEKPAHQVTLSSYSIGRYEVTQEEWRTVMGNNPSEFKGDKRPVEMVSWDDCQKFIRKLNTMTSMHFRLPTEAEWEFAARGGNNSRGYKYAGGNDLGTVAWYDGNSGSKTHSVGQKQPNELGLYDMSGNVWEWCNDWYGQYTPSMKTNPCGASTGLKHVRRGGGWGNVARNCRVSRRYPSNSTSMRNNRGFRLAL